MVALPLSQAETGMASDQPLTTNRRARSGVIPEHWPRRAPSPDVASAGGSVGR